MLITPEFLNIVKYICKKVNQVEWSGMLFYNMEGSIRNPESVVITPINIYLKDIGKHSTTGYEYDPSCIDFVENNDLMDAKHGMIHSHHSMRVFFSDTDESELSDNVENHNLYLSLVVNNFMDMDARMVYVGDPLVFECPDENGDKFELEVTGMRRMMMVHKCNIVKPVEEFNISDNLIKNLEEVTKQSIERSRKEREEAEKKKKAQEDAMRKQQQAGQGINQQAVTRGGPAWGDNWDRGGYPTGPRLSNIRDLEINESEVGEYDDFFSFCLNGGSHTNLSLGTLLQDIDESHTGEIVVDSIVRNYALYYESFYDVGNGAIEDDVFKECLEEFIEMAHLESEEYEWLILLGTGLSLVLTKFEQLNLNQG